MLDVAVPWFRQEVNNITRWIRLIFIIIYNVLVFVSLHAVFTVKSVKCHRDGSAGTFDNKQILFEI